MAPQKEKIPLREQDWWRWPIWIALYPFALLAVAVIWVIEQWGRMKMLGKGQR